MITASICLSDIPKDKIKKSEKNQKSYVTIVIDDLRQTDEYGNNKNIYVAQSKEEREAKSPKAYLGRGKEWAKFDSSSTPAAKPQPSTPAPVPPKQAASEVDDLPF